MTLRNLKKGVVAALERFGRGTDISFKVDSYVLIGYKPARLDIVRQMAGRSSRSMGRHMSKVICSDKTLTSGCIEDNLRGRNFEFIKDGIEAA